MLYPSVLSFNLEEGEPGNEGVGISLADNVLQFSIGDGIGRDHIGRLGTSRE